MTLFIHLLGQTRLLVDAQLLRFTAPPKTLPLLGYLLLHCRRPLDRQRVAFALWPAESEAAARANLRRHLHHLQHALPPAPAGRPWLLNEDGVIGWNSLADFWLDVDEFERLGQQPVTLEDAVACYTGALLPDVYDDWVFADRERLHNRYLDALLRLSIRHRTQHNYAKALDFAQQLLADEPFREDVVRQLMTLRYELGDRAGSIQEYHTFEHRLYQEMGVKPMPETHALYELVRSNVCLPDTSEPASLATLQEPEVGAMPSLGRLPFVGREAEMERLLGGWSRAARGCGSLILLSGEAGIGKTRLAGELAARVQAQGGRVLWGIGAPQAASPYHPFVTALESVLPLIAALKMEPVALAALAVLLPELEQRRRLSPLPPLDPAQEQLRLFDAVARCLEGLAAARPLLLVLEDLHNLDESGMALLQFLVRRAAHTNLLVVGIYRIEATQSAHALREQRRQLAAEHLLEYLPLGRLTTSAMAELLARLEAAQMVPAAVSAELLTHLATQSEGHPLLTELLLQHWCDTGMVDMGQLSGNVRAVIAQRLEHLPDTVYTYAAVAAVSGPAFEAEVVREVGGWDESHALICQGVLLERHLIQETTARTRFDYGFTHHLIQAVLYDTVPPAKRRRRHYRVAQVLESFYPEQRNELATELALHYDCGGAAAQAIPYYVLAARHHLRVYADTLALAALERALELAALTEISLTLRIEILLLRENILHRRGERAAQAADLHTLEQLAGAADDSDLACEVTHRRIAYHLALGERAAQHALIEILKRQAQLLDNRMWEAQALLAEGRYHALVCAYGDSRTALEAALTLYQQSADAEGQIRCLCLLADVAVQQGDFGAAQVALAQAGLLAVAQANRSLIVTTLRAASGAALARQDFATAELLATQMLALSREIGDREGEADALSRLAAVAARLFRVQEARQYYTAAGALYQALGKRQGQAAVMVNTGMLVVGRLGNYAEGLALTRAADAIFQELQDLRGQAICALNEGMITLYLEDYPASCTAAQRGLALARQINSRVMEANALSNLGAAERELGRLEAAIQHMEAGLVIRRELGQLAELGTDLCDLTVAYCRLGDIDAAQRITAEMLALYAQAEADMMHPQYMLWAAAQVQHAAGDAAAAQDLLHRAVTVMETCAEAISDTESRRTFYTLPFNRQILAAHEHNAWPSSLH